MRLTRLLGPAAALGGAALVAGLVYLPIWLHRTDPPPPSVTTPPSRVTVASVPDATLVGWHKGRKLWRFHARSIEPAADGHTTRFVGIDQGTLFLKGEAAASVAAGRAVYNDISRAVTVDGGLRLSARGLTVRTERLTWSEETDRLDCPEPVALLWRGGAATARALRADTRLRDVTGYDVRVATRLEGPMMDTVARRFGAVSAASLGLMLASAPPTGAAPPRYREIRMTGKVWRYNQATRVHTYTGAIQATDGDTTLRAERIVFNETNNTATVSGGVRVDNPRNHVEGDTAEVDFNAKVVRLRGVSGVRIVVKPRPAAGGENSLRGRVKEPVTIACRAIDYQYRTKRADATGPLTVTSGQRVLTGQNAVFTGADDLIKVTGNVRGRDEKDQTIEAPAVTVSVREGAEWIEAPNVRSTFFVREDKDEAAPAPAPADAAPPATPPNG